MNPIIFEKQMEARGCEIGENVLKASITYFTPVVCARTPIRYPNVSQAGNDLKRKYANISSIKLRLLSRYVLIPGSRDKKNRKREKERKGKKKERVNFSPIEQNKQHRCDFKRAKVICHALVQEDYLFYKGSNIAGIYIYI